MKKRIFSLLLTVLLVLSLLPGAAFAAKIENINYNGSLNTLAWKAVDGAALYGYTFLDAKDNNVLTGSTTNNYLNLSELNLPSGTYSAMISAIDANNVSITQATTSSTFTYNNPNAPTGDYYDITMTVDEGGAAGSSVNRAQAGTKVTLTATANSGYGFAGWEVVSGSVSLNDASASVITFYMPAGNVEVKAKFEPVTYYANLISSGLTGATATLSKTVHIAIGETVTLTIKANDGLNFQEAPTVSVENATAGAVTCTAPGVYTCQISDFTSHANVTVTGAATAAAAPKYTVALTREPDNGGSVTVSPATASPGETVSLTAAPNAGYVFDMWRSQNISSIDRSGEPTVTFTMPHTDPNNIEMSVVAMFSAQQFSVGLVSGLIGASAKLSSDKATVNGTVTVTITPDSGYAFKSAPTVTADAATVGTVTAGADGSYTCVVSGFAADTTIGVTGTATEIQTATHSHCVCGGDIAVGDHTKHQAVTWTAWDGTGTLPTGYVYLTKNVNKSITIHQGDSLYLCLNGHTITPSNGRVIFNKGTLTICDCGSGGALTGGNVNGYGGGVYNEGTFTLYGGSITGNTGNTGGGVRNGGAFTMYGGSIANNTVGSGSAGGVYNTGSFTLYGGSITGNSASSTGGVYNAGTLAICGGSITNNTATSTGGGLYSTDPFSVSGKIQITGNTMDGEANNMYLWAPINVGALTDGANIGVSATSSYAPTDSVPAVISAADAAAYKEYFTADDSSYEISTNAENKLVLALKQTDVYTVTFNLNGHGDAIDGQPVNSGGTATKPTAPTAAGYFFGGWYTDAACADGSEFAFTTPITADTTLYAKWTEITTLSAPANLTWDGTTAKWDAVANAFGYSVQLYKGGNAEGGAVIATETKYDFNITDAGSYTFGVKALGNGTTVLDSAEAVLYLTPLNDAAMSLSPTSYTYDGTAQEPIPTVVLNGKTLVKDTDYTVSYTDNTDAGTATVTVSGTGNYTGTATGNFAIAPRPLSVVGKVVGGDCVSKVYDGNDGVPANQFSLTPVDNNTAPMPLPSGLSVTYTDAVFKTKDAYPSSEAKDAVTVRGLALEGVDAANFTIVKDSVTLNGYIGQKPVTLTWQEPATTDWVYDGTAKCPAVTVGGVLAGDSTPSVSISVYSGYDDVNAGSVRFIPLALTGNDNYMLPTSLDDSTSPEYTIAKKQLTWDASGLTAARAEDVSGEATVHGTLALTGFVSGEETAVTFAPTSGLVTSGLAGKTAPGSYSVEVVGASAYVFSPSVPSNYILPTGNPSITATVNEVSPLPQPPELNDPNQYRVDMEEGISEVPDGLKQTQFDTPAKIVEELSRVLTTGTGYTEGNVATFDVTLQFSPDGGQTWRDATEANFPAAGITVVLPYPTGTSADTHDFKVTHMFTVTSTRLGTTAGDTEEPDVRETANGIQVTLKGLSPVGIAWKANEAQFGKQDPDTGILEVPDTGDNGHMGLWLGFLLLCAAGAARVLLVRCRRRKEE